MEVTWVNRKGDRIAAEFAVPLPASLIAYNRTGTIVPEYGQSVVTAEQQAIRRLATQIVERMESPW